jgi:hypothetical protein
MHSCISYRQQRSYLCTALVVMFSNWSFSWNMIWNFLIQIMLILIFGILKICFSLTREPEASKLFVDITLYITVLLFVHFVWTVWISSLWWINSNILIYYGVICVGLWPHACWDRGFESHWGHGCLSVWGVVCCQLEVSATSWSFVQRSPTNCGASLYVI